METGRPVQCSPHRVRQQDGPARGRPDKLRRHDTGHTQGEHPWSCSSLSRKGTSFLGIVDVITGQAILYDKDRMGYEYSVVEMPEQMRAAYEQAREEMMEKLSEVDDSFMDAFLHGKEITEADMRRVIRKGTLEGSILPVLCGTAFKNKGIQPLLDAIVDYLPCPTDVSPHVFWNEEGEEGHIQGSVDEPFSGLVFKIMNDPFVGQLSYVRIYSGKLKQGETVLNSTKGKS